MNDSASVKEHQSRFWTFSLTVYGDAAVQRECLDLQDRYGIDVNLLLFCAFIGAVHGAVLPDHDLRQAVDLVSEWHKKIVTNLREARRALKPFATDGSSNVEAVASLRTDVKSKELEAERLEQMMLASWSRARVASWPRMQAAEAVTANIRALFALGAAAAGAPGQPHHLVAAAVAAAR
jgi:uncharacterized protein (TIGR02444 family)